MNPGPVRVDEPASKPLANATFVVQTDANAVATEFATDAQGSFRVLLPPGHYKVSLKSKKGGIGKYGPFEVDVAADRMTAIPSSFHSGQSTLIPPTKHTKAAKTFRDNFRIFRVFH